ncbi:hypothetical protein ACI2KS_10330 [Pseudomonas sp. NPDC087358]|uniref:hypothetical protein n=1 Tax=Pseudomonas sp. NPDC087358 TaxID=3364439 RepID=UPI00384AE189
MTSIPESLAKFGFVFKGEVVSPTGEVISSGSYTNIIPQAGIDHIVGLLRGTGTLNSSWYVGVGASNYVPSSATTATDLPAAVGEATGYSQATRPIWSNTYDGVSSVDNLSTKAEFTFTAATRLYSGFLCSNSGKGSNSGILLSISRFASPYDVPAGSTFRLGISISLLSAA